MVKAYFDEGLKPDNRMMDCDDFNEKSILNHGEDEDSKLIRDDGTIVPDPNLLGIQLDGWYSVPARTDRYTPYRTDGQPARFRSIFRQMR